MLLKIGLFSGLTMFGGTLYYTYHSYAFEKYTPEYKDIISSKQKFYEHQNNIMYNAYKNIMDSDSQQGLPKYRKILLKQVYGNVLETNTGESNNIMFYNKNKVKKLTCIDYQIKAIQSMVNKETEIPLEIKMEDSEDMGFQDDQFDCVVDTFGLEFNFNPQKALQEIKRVCKKDGLIFLMENGKSNHQYYDKYIQWKEPIRLVQQGKFQGRDWEKIIESQNFEIIQNKKFFLGTLHFYILRNKKQSIT